MTLFYFPAPLLRERSVSFGLRGVAIGGGQTASGAMPTTTIDGGGIWGAELTDIPLATADQVRAWRALVAICDSGAMPIVVPMGDKRFMPAPLVNGVPLAVIPKVPHSDGSTFSDGSPYVSDVVEATLADDASLRATALVVRLATGSAFRGGEHFSIDHDTLRWRLYLIRTATPNGDGTFNVTIRPPLRADVKSGAVLQFDVPKCVMRLAAPDAAKLTLDMRHIGKPSISFIEAFPPFPA